MRYAKIDGRPDLVKDLQSGAILNIVKEQDDEYKRQSALINNTKQAQKDISELKEKLSDFDNMKNELTEIKSLLKELVSK